MANSPRPALICPLCEGTESDRIFESANGYAIVRCRECALVFTDARTAPPPDQLYPHFDQSDGVALQSMRSSLSIFLRQRAHVVRKQKKSGRLLDYGCGNGSFAHWMSTTGFEVVGLEPFSLGSPRVSERLTLLREPLESAAPRLGKFDVITLWHVLEHIPHPVDLLKRLRALLADDGVIVVSVPNFDSLQSKLFKGGWFHLDPPRHLIHFDKESLARSLARAELEPLNESPFLPEYGGSGWVQSVLNQVLPHNNYLYEYVKDRGALKEMTPASSALHLAASLAIAAPVLTLSLPIELAASRSAMGAALTVAARPR
jgi:SAM-dependent methyltransferase